MAVRFTLGRGTTAVRFDRATPHTAKWDDQKKGLRMHLGLPAHGNIYGHSDGVYGK